MKCLLHPAYRAANNGKPPISHAVYSLKCDQHTHTANCIIWN